MLFTGLSRSVWEKPVPVVLSMALGLQSRAVLMTSGTVFSHTDLPPGKLHIFPLLPPKMDHQYLAHVISTGFYIGKGHDYLRLKPPKFEFMEFNFFPCYFVNIINISVLFQNITVKPTSKQSFLRFVSLTT